MASENGHLNIVKELMLNKVDIDATDSRGCHALILASTYGHAAVTKELLDNESEIAILNHDGKSALSIECHYGKLEIVNKLLQKTKCHNYSRKLSSYIDDTLQKEKNDIDDCQIKEMIHQYKLYKDTQEAKRILNQTNSLEKTEVMEEAQFKKVIDDLKLYSTSLKVCDDCLLHAAITDGSVELVEKLIECGADVTEKDNSGLTPLMMAAINGNDKLFDKLCKNSKVVLLIRQELEEVVLHLACQIGNVEIVKTILEFTPNMNVNQTDKSGYTALMYASIKGHIAIILNLIKRGACINYKDEHDKTALYMSSAGGRVKSVHTLLDQGATFDVTNDSTSALYIACKYGHFEVVKLLIKSLNQLFLHENIMSSLHIACSNNSTEDEMEAAYLRIVIELLNNGAEINQQDRNGWHSLMFAAQSGNIGIFQYLLSRDVNADLLDNNGKSALHISSENGHSAITEKLLQVGVTVNLQNKTGLTALHLASQNGHVKCVKILLEYYADTNITADNGYNALHLASENGNLQVVKELLIKNSIMVDSHSSSGITALCLACRNGHLKVTRELIQCGAQINQITEKGFSALHVASAFGYMEIVNELLNHKALVNMQGDCEDSAFCTMNSEEIFQTPNEKANDKEDMEKNLFVKEKSSRILRQYFSLFENGYTRQNEPEGGMKGWHALLFASSKGHETVVNALLKNGAEVNLQSIEGTSALYTASQNGHCEIVRKLIKQNAEINVLNSKCLTPLHVAAAYGQRQIVEELLKNGAIVDIQSDLELSPLHFASVRNNIHIVNSLICHGASVNIKDCKGWSPLTLACSHEYIEIVDLMLRPYECLTSIVTEALDRSAYTNTAMVKFTLSRFNLAWLRKQLAFHQATAASSCQLATSNQVH